MYTLGLAVFSLSNERAGPMKRSHSRLTADGLVLTNKKMLCWTLVPCACYGDGALLDWRLRPGVRSSYEPAVAAVGARSGCAAGARASGCVPFPLHPHAALPFVGLCCGGAPRADVSSCADVLFISNSVANARGRGRQAAVDMSGPRVLEDPAAQVSRTHVSLALVLHVVFG